MEIPDKPFCAKCGNRLEPGASFCSHCASPTDGDPRPTSRTDPSAMPLFAKIAMAAGIFILLIIIIGSLFSSPPDQSGSSGAPPPSRADVPSGGVAPSESAPSSDGTADDEPSRPPTVPGTIVVTLGGEVCPTLETVHLFDNALANLTANMLSLPINQVVQQSQPGYATGRELEAGYAAGCITVPSDSRIDLLSTIENPDNQTTPGVFGPLYRVQIEGGRGGFMPFLPETYSQLGPAQSARDNSTVPQTDSGQSALAQVRPPAPKSYDPIPKAWNTETIDLPGTLAVGTEYCTQQGECKFVGGEVAGLAQTCLETPNAEPCLKARIPVEILVPGIVRLNGRNYAVSRNTWNTTEPDGSITGSGVIYHGAAISWDQYKSLFDSQKATPQARTGPAKPEAQQSAPPEATTATAAMQPFTSAAGHFSVVFPATPQQSSQPLRQTTGEMTTVYKFSADDGNANYTAEYIDYTLASVGASPRAFLQGSENLALAGKTPLTDAVIGFGAIPGRAFTFADADGFSYSIHEFLAGTRFYRLIVITRKGYTATQADQFMNSFKLVGQ